MYCFAPVKERGTRRTTVMYGYGQKYGEKTTSQHIAGRSRLVDLFVPEDCIRAQKSIELHVH